MFQRGLDPKRAMNIGDLALRKKEEQDEATQKMTETAMTHLAMCDVLRFLETNLGQVHRVTIDFRKNVLKKYRIEAEKAAEHYAECGAMDETLKSIDENHKLYT
jgi:hypothetical protein